MPTPFLNQIVNLLPARKITLTFSKKENVLPVSLILLHRRLDAFSNLSKEVPTSLSFVGLGLLPFQRQKSSINFVCKAQLIKHTKYHCIKHGHYF